MNKFLELLALMQIVLAVYGKFVAVYHPH